MRIIIALPESTMRDTLLRMLRKRLSHNVLQVVDSGSALEEAIVTLRPQVVVMDTLLPEKDGITVLYELRRLPEEQQPEIILLSSLASERIISEVARLRPTCFTTLPCDIQRLADRIMLCCRERLRLGLEHCTGVEQAIVHCQHSLGLSARAKGFPYAREAVLRIYREPALAHALTKCLYPDIARKFGTNPACVERAIRSAILAAWEKNDIPFQQLLFHKRPTNGEFFSVIANFLREELREEAE